MSGLTARTRTALWGAAACLLLLPLVAMQFTQEVAWDGADFVIFGIMLAAACGAYELAVRLTPVAAFRAIAGMAIVAVFVLVWLQLAVGLVGDP